MSIVMNDDVNTTSVMICEGIGAADIKLITSMENIVVDDCEMSLRLENISDLNSLNRKINSKIRTRPTVDNMKPENN